jgi:hypothetical protein
MQIEKQFAITGINKPGVLANICRVLADEKVNIKALTITDSEGHDVMRMVVDKPDLARTLLSKIDSPVKESKVITVEITNKPGAFAALAEKLGRAHINIESAYCTSGTPNGRATAIFEVPYIEKTMKVMQDTLSRRQERILPNVQAPLARR